MLLAVRIRRNMGFVIGVVMKLHPDGLKLIPLPYTVFPVQNYLKRPMKRLDVSVSEKYNISRSFSAKLIKAGKVRVGHIVETSASKKITDAVNDDILLDEAEDRKSTRL